MGLLLLSVSVLPSWARGTERRGVYRASGTLGTPIQPFLVHRAGKAIVVGYNPKRTGDDEQQYENHRYRTVGLWDVAGVGRCVSLHVGRQDDLSGRAVRQRHLDRKHQRTAAFSIRTDEGC